MSVPRAYVRRDGPGGPVRKSGGVGGGQLALHADRTSAAAVRHRRESATAPASSRARREGNGVRAVARQRRPSDELQGSARLLPHHAPVQRPRLHRRLQLRRFGRRGRVPSPHQNLHGGPGRRRTSAEWSGSEKDDEEANERGEEAGQRAGQTGQVGEAQEADEGGYLVALLLHSPHETRPRRRDDAAGHARGAGVAVAVAVGTSDVTAQ